MRVILPVCGDSTRFPGRLPKWLLTHPSGNLMFVEALRGLDLSAVDEVVIVARRDHDETFGVRAALNAQFERQGLGAPHRLVLIDRTVSQPETVVRAIEALAIDGPILIKDADNRFACPVRPGNVVMTLELAAAGVTNAVNKSYVEIDDHGRILNIVEKQVISGTFCVGGYGFESAEEFADTFARLDPSTGLYVSHLIYALLLDGREFTSEPVRDFADWGTAADWDRFTRGYATLFVDLDGVLVAPGSGYFSPRWGETGARPGVAEALQRLHAAGRVHIVVTSSRPEEEAAATGEQLRRLGIPCHRLLLGLPHARGVLACGYDAERPYPMAQAVNVPADAGDLTPLLEGLFDALRER